MALFTEEQAPVVYTDASTVSTGVDAAQWWLETRLYHKALCFVLYFVAASASFNGYYDKWHFREAGVSGAYGPAQFDMVVNGTASRPFVYRQMLPAIANWVDKVTPVSFKTRLYNPQGKGCEGILCTLFDSPVARNRQYFFRYLLVYVATFLFAWLAVYNMHLVCKALHTPTAAAVFAPIIVILLFPYIQSVGGYSYDYPELAFFALATWMALKSDWWWIVPVAALGAWNKESFLLFVPTLYPILRRRSSHRSALLGTGVMCIACVAVYFPVRLFFAKNPGGSVRLGVIEQLSYLMHPNFLFFNVEKTYGLILPRIFTVLPLAMLIWIVRRSWTHVPLIMRRHGRLAALINLPLFILFCYPGELRDLSLLYMVFLVIVAGNVTELMNALSPIHDVTGAEVTGTRSEALS
jgi:hypothetical protein